MAHPLLWPKKTYFFPVGTTPATCFTRHLAPEEAADILLLGCGDPRSILYTVHADLGAPDRKLDFTCCDVEPAILARNVILLTMLIDRCDDDSQLDKAWDVFYHFYLDKGALDLLLDQCQILIDVSSDIKTWDSSKYGGIFKFCTDNSLSEVRRHWILYSETTQLPQSERKDLESSFSSRKKLVSKHHGDVRTSVRCAGPFWNSLAPMGSDHFHKYWATGTTTTEPAPDVNPTFAYSLSGRAFNVHNGTDPILGYHLAAALAHTKEMPRGPSTKPEDLDLFVKSQFRLWCRSFSKRATSKSPKLVLRLFVGDALAFCQALHRCGQDGVTDAGVYTGPWGGSTIQLVRDDYELASSSQAPLAFNIIDTSTLSDYLGLVNLLMRARPLLRRTPSSVLHTQTFLFPDKPRDVRKTLLEKVCADIPMLSLLLGFAPTRHLFSYTSDCNVHEVLSFLQFDNPFSEAMSWKLVPLRDVPSEQRLIFDSHQLGEFLFSVYLKMFADENNEDNMKDPTNEFLLKQKDVHYHRGTFAEFLAFVKTRVDTEWENTMDHLISRIKSDKILMVGMNYFQDLCCNLHLQGVHSCVQDLYGARGSQELFQGWNDIPPVVCVVLVVPRQALKPLENMKPNEIMTPSLRCETRGPAFRNIHSSIRPIFGNVEVVRTGGEPSVIIREDRRGWSGTSSLIISLYMASGVLMVAPKKTEICFGVRQSTSSILMLGGVLGIMLNIYSTSATDAEHVYIVRHHPDHSKHIQDLPAVNPVDSTLSGPLTATLDAIGTKLSYLTRRVDIVDPKARDNLSRNAMVITKQLSDFAVAVTFEGFQKILSYPIHIDGSRLKTRIARKSFYIEVVAFTVADPLDRPDFPLEPFPVLIKNRIPQLLNSHYLRLDELPRLDIPSTPDVTWLDTFHLAMILSDHERATKALANRGTLVNFKLRLMSVFTAFYNVAKGQPVVISLSKPAKNSFHTLIFVSDLRLDLVGNTVVADACILPITEAILDNDRVCDCIDRIIKDVRYQGGVLEEETIAWKHILPVLTERCRTWKHGKGCEYLVKGIPASVDVDESPICGCGRGKDLGAFSKNPAWKGLSQHVTRIALGPLFSTSFMEGLLDPEPQSGPKPRSPERTVLGNDEQCSQCGKPGNPKLLVCGGCKTTKYCSASCQKAHWKKHKPLCTQSK